MGKTALITGASGGIGYELALLAAKDLYDLVLVARNRQKLEMIRQDLEADFKVRVHPLVKDLARPGSADEVVDEVEGLGLSIDMLVNNAGFGDFGRFVDTDPAREAEMLQLNVVTLTRLTKLFVRSMVERKAGKILNVASVAAFQPGPLMAVYYATKAYVLSFSEAIADELRGTGVTVTVLCPGPTETGFADTASLDDSNLFKLMPVSDPVEVARYGYQAMMNGEVVAIPGLVNKTMVLSQRFAPRSLVTRLVRMIQG